MELEIRLEINKDSSGMGNDYKSKDSIGMGNKARNQLNCYWDGKYGSKS